MGGFIKLWRKCLDTGFLRNHKLWAFWTWCLLKASHKEHAVMIGYQKIELRPGQFVFGRLKAAQDLGMSERSIRTCLKSLMLAEMLSVKSTNKYSIITILNWATYQSVDDPHDPANRPGDDQQVTTYKNGKNDKNPLIAEIINYLNDRACKKFRPSSRSAARYIKARLHEGYTLEQFKQVIDTKVAQWKDSASYNKFLRPQTLFGEKFESYLNENPSSKSPYFGGWK